MGVYYNGSSGIPTGGFTVVAPRHWLFHGVHVDSAQAFGAPMVGFEVDARTPESPRHIEVIARAELPDVVDAPTGTGSGAPRDFVRVERSPDGFALIVGSTSRVRGTLDVYDASGRRVRRFARVFDSGTTRIDWDLRDDHGREFSSGTYFLQARIGPRSSSQKLVLRR